MHRQHDRVVETIYHSAITFGEWQSVLQQLVELLNGRSARMLFMNAAATKVNSSLALNIDDGYHRQYVDYYVNACPWRPELAKKKKGLMYSTYLDFSCDQRGYHGTEFYNDWARQQGIEHGICGNVVTTADYSVQLLVQRTKVPGHFTREETDQVNRLLPHMRRALELQQIMERERQLREAGIRAAERAPMPFLLLDTALTLVYMTPEAEQRMAAHPALGIVNDRLVCRDPTTHSRLQTLLAATAATADNRWQGAGGSVTIPAAALPVELLIYPLHPAHQGIFSDGRPYVVVYINDARQRLILDAPLAEARFGLTAAEIALAEAIVNGETLEEFATRRGTSMNTVRTQAKHLLGKAAARRQAELSKILAPYLSRR